VLRWLADENFNNDILRALFRASRDLDIVRAQDVGLTGTGDETLLAWAAGQKRVLLTHDVSTITAHAYRRVMKGEPMPGVFEVSRRIPIRAAVEDIILLSECSNSDEWEGQVRYLPLR
jgi:hypothetical protein